MKNTSDNKTSYPEYSFEERKRRIDGMWAAAEKYKGTLIVNNKALLY